MVDLTGRSLGSYQIREEIGRGGMAVVYRAYQPSLNRYVAIKVLPPQLAFDQKFVDRFLREARSAASLRHPNIVVVHDVGEQDGLYYIVMEYLEGRTLRQLIEQDGPLPPKRAANILEQLASALDYAHGRGFVHRDVKPANIFVGEGPSTGTGDRVTLTDFGIAKAVSEAEQLTRTGMLVGTPEYMAPEQAEGGDVDHRTDLYALGVVLYQMLTGRVPFRASTPQATLYAVVHRSPPLPRRVNPNLPSAVESVILRAVDKRPERRFQRGAQLTAALRTALASPSSAPATPRAGRKPRRPTPRPARRRSPVVWIMAALAAVLVLMLGALALLLVTGGGSETPIPTFTQAVAWQTPTPGVTDTVLTPEPTATSLPPGDTETLVPQSPAADTDTLAPLTDTPLPPTDTPKPPTHTPTLTLTPSPTPCPIQAQGLFAGLWQAYIVRIGCPLHPQPKAIQDAEQAFDNGHMFWRADNDRAYVVYEKGPPNGTYQSFTGMWSEGDPEYSCPASPPPGKVQPKRGFGAVWCDLGGPGSPIGWGLGEERGFGPGNGDPLVQSFERGVIFRDSDGKTTGRSYIFFADGSFVRVSY